MNIIVLTMTPRLSPLMEPLENRQLLDTSVALAYDSGIITFVADERGPIDDACKDASDRSYWGVWVANAVVSGVLDYGTAAGIVYFGARSEVSMWMVGTQVVPACALMLAVVQTGFVGLTAVLAGNSPALDCEGESGLVGYFAQAGAVGALVADILFVGSILTVAGFYGLSAVFHHVNSPIYQSIA